MAASFMADRLYNYLVLHKRYSFGKKVLFICKNQLITVLYHPIYHCIVIQKRQYINTTKLCIIIPLVHMYAEEIIIVWHLTFSDQFGQMSEHFKTNYLINCTDVQPNLVTMWLFWLLSNHFYWVIISSVCMCMYISASIKIFKFIIR